MANAHCMALNHYNIGHTLFAEKNFPEAAVAFESAIRVCEEAIRRGDRDVRPVIDLARALVYLGRVRLQGGATRRRVGAEPAGHRDLPGPP